MMLNIGHMAKTYGILPSKVLQDATTYDLMITDVYNSWEKYEYEKANGKNTPPSLTPEEMAKMMEKARSLNG